MGIRICIYCKKREMVRRECKIARCHKCSVKIHTKKQTLKLIIKKMNLLKLKIEKLKKELKEDSEWNLK